jgi:hypothetical protein
MLREPGRSRLDALLRFTDHLFGAEAGGALAEPWLARYLVLAAVLAVVLVLRRPDAILNPQFWAEDGRIYFSEQLTLGFWSALLKGYKGFPYAAERGIAALGSAVPLVEVPLAYNVVSIVVTALAMATFSVPGFRHLIHGNALRVITCLAIVCIPAGQELVATATNVGWWLMVWLVFLSVVRAPRALALNIGWCVGGALAVLSTPLAPVAAPLWVLRAVHGAWGRRASDLSFALVQLTTLFALVLLTALGAGDYLLADASIALLKGGALTHWEPHHLTAGLRMLPYVTAWTVDAALLPTNAYPALRNLGTVQTIAPSLVLAAAIGLAWRDLSARGRMTVGLAAYLFVTSLLVTLIGRHDLVRGFEALPAAHLQRVELLSHRYRLLPHAALVLAVAAIIDSARHVRTRSVAIAFACAGLLTWAPEFRIPPYLDEQWPVWAAKLEQKLASGNRDPMVIPINPRLSTMDFDLGAVPRSGSATSPPPH